MWWFNDPEATKWGLIAAIIVLTMPIWGMVLIFILCLFFQ